MRYYTAQQTLELLNKELPHNPLPYDMAQLADLCRRDTITPIFYYQRYAHHIDAETFEPLPQPHLFKCYLTSTDLLMLFNSQTARVSINRATIYEARNSTHLQAGDEVLLTDNNFHYCFEVLKDSDFYNAFFTTPDSPYSVTLNDLLFPSEQVQRYIAWHDFADVTTPEQQRIAELESELAQAHADNEQLRRQHSAPADDDKELEANTQAAVTRLLNVLFHMSGHDLSAHSGTLNKNIYDYSRHPSIETPITKVFISDWIKRVQQLRIDTKEKQNTGAYDRHVT